MPIKALHLCCKPGCTTLTRERYCTKHKSETNRYNRERTDKEYVAFYKTKEWQLVRGLALARDGYQCVSCKKKGIRKQAEMVHHKIPVKKDWSKRLELTNLESLCEACHNAIEHQKPPRHPILGEPPEEERRPTTCQKSHISLGGIKKTGLNKGYPVLLLIRKEKLYG